MEERTHIVIGAGIIGSWTAWHLQKNGCKTVLIDNFPLPHTRGSSHGASRVIRYLGDDNLSKLEYSFGKWKELEEECGSKLLVTTGLINFGSCDTNTGKCTDDYLHKHMNVLKDSGKPLKWLPPDEIKERYPNINYPNDWGAIFDPSGGILLAHTCLTSVQQSFSSMGGTLMQGKVTAIENGGYIKILFPSENEAIDLKFEQIIVCSGPWTSQLFPGLKKHLKVKAIPVTYWKDLTENLAYSTSQKFPVIFNARLTNIYGIPSYEYPGMTKILLHGGPEAHPDYRDVPSVEEEVKYVSDYVKKHLPGLDHGNGKPAILEKCLYTITTDSQPIIDHYGPGLVLGCGFSGSGFKNSPAWGKMLACLALGKEAEIPEGFQLNNYRLDRFN